MTFSFIRTAARDGIFEIRLARPPANVLHAPMMAEIGAALDEAAGREELCALAVTSALPRLYSGGVEVADHSRARIAALMADFAALLRRLRDFPLPTVAALHGDTLGGGLELALACDMMVAVPQARLGHPEIRLASIAFPGILMLQGRLPPNVITELLASGEPLSGADAHRLGLVNRLLEPADFDAELRAFLAPYTRLSRAALRLLMRTLRGARGQTLDSGFDAAARLYLDELLALEDAEEGVRAFAEKRAPAWKHR